MEKIELLAKEFFKLKSLKEKIFFYEKNNILPTRRQLFDNGKVFGIIPPDESSNQRWTPEESSNKKWSPEEYRLYNEWIMKANMESLKKRGINKIYGFPIKSYSELVEEFRKIINKTPDKEGYIELQKEKYIKEYIKGGKIKLIFEQERKRQINVEEIDLTKYLDSEMLSFYPIIKPYVDYFIFLKTYLKADTPKLESNLKKGHHIFSEKKPTISNNSPIKLDQNKAIDKSSKRTFKWLSSPEELEALFNVLKGNFISQNTTLENFKKCFSDEAIKIQNPIKWICTNSKNNQTNKLALLTFIQILVEKEKIDSFEAFQENPKNNSELFNTCSNCFIGNNEEVLKFSSSNKPTKTRVSDFHQNLEKNINSLG